MGLKEGLNTKGKKEASNRERPLIKHEKELKIRLFPVRVGAQKCKQERLRLHAK